MICNYFLIYRDINTNEMKEEQIAIIDLFIGTV